MAQMELDEIFYAALTSDEGIMTATGGRIISTCFEVSPEKDDNTPLPYIIITDDPFTNEQGTKDTIWESNQDSVQAGVEISAISPKEVKRLRRMVRKAINDYISTMEGDIPELQSLTNEGIQWDWMKPCYWDKLHYQCVVENIEDDEQD